MMHELAAYVREDENDYERFLASFTVKVERADQPWWRSALETLEGADLGTAVAWARERASVVLVTVGRDETFSAGDHNPESASFRPLPDAALELKPRWRRAAWDGSLPPGLKEPGPVRRYVKRRWFHAAYVGASLVLGKALDLHGWEELAVPLGLLAVVVVRVFVPWERFVPGSDDERGVDRAPAVGTADAQ
jgi:hypothetical protein